VSKKRPSSKKRAAAGRKSAASRSSKGRPKARATAAKRPTKLTSDPDKIYLGPLRADLQRTLAEIKAAPQSQRTKVTIERLQRCVAEFDAICDPLDPDGCGPNMDFPRQ
jgi:hypothetical protein